MISVDEAQDRVLQLVEALSCETVELAEAGGRVLRAQVVSRRDQPPFAASAMDGYAVKQAEVKAGATFNVIGESAAGHGYAGALKTGEAVRIFTGAPVPEGADYVIIQEDVARSGDQICLQEGFDTSPYVRPAGSDFKTGATITAPRRLAPADLALIAAMNTPCVTVTRKPQIAILATGDELVLPGGHPRADQIIASNSFGLKAMVDQAGGRGRLLPISQDSIASLTDSFQRAESADLIVTIGGASVGDHDLVATAAAELGMEQSFYKVAMRPGKPLMAGRIGKTPMLGLPGNPVSALVCGAVFLLPMIRKMLGHADWTTKTLQAPLSAPLPANGPRAHYMRARLDQEGIKAFGRQDSSLLTVLADANALLIRPPHDPARSVGETVEYLPL